MTESIKEIMKEITDTGQKKDGGVGGEGFQDIDLGEIQDW